jgi:RecA/RadA recombinase
MSENVSAFFKGFIDEGRSKFGDDRVLVGTQEEENQFGLELPSFALQYLYHSNILPMGKILGLAGQPASCKSANLFDIMRMCLSAGGVAHLVETENKVNLHFLNSIIGHENSGSIRIDSASTVQEAQDSVSSAINYYKEHCPDKDIPFVIGVDSLAGNTTEDIKKDISKDGHAGRAYPEAALLYTNFFKSLASELIGLPIVVVYTNHLKDKIDGANPNIKTKSGGVAQDFHAAQYIYMSKIKDIELVSREGKLIKMKVQKCGLGPANREIEVPILWDFETVDDKDDPVQVTKWDWHAATARLLVSKKLNGRVAKVSDVTCSSNRYSSKRLELTKVDDSELGEALFNDKQYMKDLQKACGFRNWKVFGNG